MEDYEVAYCLAMDDTDPQLVKKAMEIGQSQLTYEQKTEAIWALFQERRKKLAEQKAKKVSFVGIDDRGNLLPKEQRETTGSGQSLSR